LLAAEANVLYPADPGKRFPQGGKNLRGSAEAGSRNDLRSLASLNISRRSIPRAPVKYASPRLNPPRGSALDGASSPSEFHRAGMTCCRRPGMSSRGWRGMIYVSNTSAGKSNLSIKSSSAYDNMSVFLPCDLTG